MKLLFFALALMFVTSSHAFAQDQATVVASCGTAHLTAGTQAFRTVDVNGVTCSGAGSVATGCSQATAYLARATGETAHAADLTTLICGLVTDGVWAKLDALYVLAQQNVTDAKLNLVSASYTLSGTGATFTAYRGYSAFVTHGMDTGFNASSSPSPNFVLNSASISAWIYNTPDGSCQIGTSASSGASYIFANLGPTFYAGTNSSGTPSGTPAPGVFGFYSGDRSGNTTTTYYLNGVNKFVDTIVSASFDGVDMFIGGRSIDYPTTNTISEAHIGASLGSAGNLALYNRLRTYMTAVGVP